MSNRQEDLRLVVNELVVGQVALINARAFQMSATLNVADVRTEIPNPSGAIEALETVIQGCEIALSALALLSVDRYRIEAIERLKELTEKLLFVTKEKFQ